MSKILRNAYLEPPHIYQPEDETFFSLIPGRFASLNLPSIQDFFFFLHRLGPCSSIKEFLFNNSSIPHGKLNWCPPIFSLFWNSPSNRSQCILIHLTWIILRFAGLRIPQGEFSPFPCELSWVTYCF